MAKLKEGDEILIRAVVKTVWPKTNEVTVFIKSATVGGLLTLLDDRDIEPVGKKRDRLV